MTTRFTAEEFEGYEFVCTTEDANTGFNHVCRVMKDGEEVLKTRVNWGNRTWESYQYASVFEQAKGILYDKLNNSKDELDTDFLMRLVNSCLIDDYGEDEDGYPHILVGSWNQIEEGSAWDTLIRLAKKGLLKPSVNKTMLALEDSQLFTDEYSRCSECGRIFNHQWGDLKIIDYEWVCDDCINENPEYIEELVDRAKENYELASGRYKVGYGNVIELKDAQVALSDAKKMYYQTIYEYNSARANLERAIGQTIKSDEGKKIEIFEEEKNTQEL